MSKVTTENPQKWTGILSLVLVALKDKIYVFVSGLVATSSTEVILNKTCYAEL